MSALIRRRLSCRTMQALDHCRVARHLHWATGGSLNADIGPLWSLQMQALVHYEVFQCRHWPTNKSSNAGIWSHSLPALQDCEVNQCKHWLFIKSPNACIGRLWCHPMKAWWSTVDVEFSLMSISRKLSFLFYWCIQSLNTYVWTLILFISSTPLMNQIRS